MLYDPMRHYWLVGNRPGRVFSSQAPGYLPLTDAGYSGWLAAGNPPTSILSDGELAHVLLHAAASTAAVVAAGASSFGGLSPVETLELVQAIGATVTSAGTPALSAAYEISGQPWQDMRDTALYIQTYSAFPAGAASLPWIARDKTVTMDTTGHFLAVVRGLADYLTKWKIYLANGGTAPTLGTVTIA